MFAEAHFQNENHILFQISCLIVICRELKIDALFRNEVAPVSLGFTDQHTHEDALGRQNNLDTYHFFQKDNFLKKSN